LRLLIPILLLNALISLALILLHHRSVLRPTSRTLFRIQSSLLAIGICRPVIMS
jgi:hypothetical protein